MDGRTLVTFFTLQSPWSYLGHAPLCTVAAKHGARIDFRPMNLLEVFPESGGLPLTRRHPLRRAYRDIELMRWRDKRGVMLNLRPAFWPLDITLADRTIIALIAAGHDPARFIAEAFEALWAKDLNLADPEALKGILQICGFDVATVVDEAQGPEATAIYAANTRQALAFGVFGAPTTILDGEPFWGQDRIDLLDEALATGRAPLSVAQISP